MLKLYRNVMLKAPDFRSVVSSATPMIEVWKFKDWNPEVFRATIPMDSYYLTKATNFTITTCHLTKSVTIVATRAGRDLPTQEFTDDNSRMPEPELR